MEDFNCDHAAFADQPSVRFAGVCSGGWTPLNILTIDNAQAFVADINPHQLEWLRFIMAAIKGIDDHDVLFQLFGRGGHASIRELYYDAIRQHLEHPRYWDSRYHWFARSYCVHTTAGFGLCVLRRYARMVSGDRKLHSFLNADTLSEQSEMYRSMSDRLFNRLARTLLATRYALARFGIVAPQIRLASGHAFDYVRWMKENLERLFAAIPMNNNWFWHLVFTGHIPEGAAPQWMRVENIRKVRGNLDRLRLYSGDLVDMVERLSSRPPTVVSLSDSLDWLPPAQWPKRLERLRRALPLRTIILQRSIIPDADLSRIAAGWKKIDAAAHYAEQELTGCYPGYFWYELV